MGERRYCTCDDWKVNLPKVEAPRMFAAARNPGTWNYDGKPFKYCPWCATELLVAEPSNDA